MASPSVTQNLSAIASTGLTAGAVVSSSAISLLTKFEGHFQVAATFSNVGAAGGVLVAASRDVTGGSTFDVVSATAFVIPGVTSTVQLASFVLGNGNWKIFISNIDPSNVVTCSCRYETVDSVA